MEALPEYKYLSEEYVLAKNMGELEDLQRFINFYQELLFQDNPSSEQTPGVKRRPRKRESIRQAYEYKINEFGRKFGLQPYELVENIKAGSPLHTPPDIKQRPSQIAYEYLSEKYTSEINILLGVCKYISEELAAQPPVNRILRDYYTQHAMVTTTPTDLGLKELDIFHPSFRIKRITSKPIASFVDDMWIDIQNNVKAKFINVKVFVNSQQSDAIFQKLSSLYCGIGFEGGEGVENEWNVLRQEALRKLINDNFLPQFEAQIKNQLYEEAEEYVIKCCKEKFRKMLMSGPYRKISELRSNGEEVMISENAKVMAFVMENEDSRKNLVQMAMLDQNGELIQDYLFKNLAFRSTKNLNQTDQTLFEK